jgi:hypothetical protein
VYRGAGRQRHLRIPGFPVRKDVGEVGHHPAGFHLYNDIRTHCDWAFDLIDRHRLADGVQPSGAHQLRHIFPPKLSKIASH